MNIYVGNLNYRVREDDLKQVMEEYGTVESVKIIKDLSLIHIFAASGTEYDSIPALLNTGHTRHVQQLPLHPYPTDNLKSIEPDSYPIHL